MSVDNGTPALPELRQETGSLSKLPGFFRRKLSVKNDGIDVEAAKAAALRFGFPCPSPPEPLKWVPATVKNIPANAVTGGFEATRLRIRDLQLGRALTQYGWIPGKAGSFLEGCLLGLDGREQASAEFEVLTIPTESSGMLVWRMQSRPLLEVPSGAFVAGSFRKDKQDIPLYIARTRYRGGIHCGYVALGDPMGMSMGWGGLEVRVATDFEVLVLLSEDDRTREELYMAFDGHHADSGNRGGNFDHAEPSVMERAIGLGMRVNSLGLDGVESDGFLELDSERSKLLVRVTQNRTGSASQMLTEIDLAAIREVREGIEVCPTTAIAKAWVMTLRAVAQRHNANELLVTSYLEVIEAATAASWKAAIRDVPKGDKDRALINMERLTRMFYKMNYNLPKDSIRLLFSTFDGDRSGELDFDEFTNLWKLVKIRRDIRPIFDSLAESSGSDGEVVVTSRKFRHFLSSVQKAELNEEQFSALLETYSQTNDSLTAQEFEKFLTSHHTAIFSPRDLAVNQDMTRPVSEYFINSSHNTYLLGDQLASSSHVQGYVRAFQLGAKCVELDVFDGKDGNPLIYHGGTLTSAIRFRDVIETVKDYGFCVSDYPVILSLENHCSTPQQQVMASILKEVLGDMLVTELLPHVEVGRLPSPEDLKGRILLKDRAYAPDVSITGRKSISASSTAISDRLRETSGTENSFGGSATLAESNDASLVDTTRAPKRISTREALQLEALDADVDENVVDQDHISNALGSMIVYFQANLFRSFDTAKWNWISSFSEGQALKLIETSRSKFLDFNRRQMSRIYPSGKRVDSSNYNPQPYWDVGAQLVALNTQTVDQWTAANRAMFFSNGNCGYVLKPDWQRGIGEPPAKCLVTIEIISGQQLPKPADQGDESEVIDPYVQVELLGRNTRLVSLNNDRSSSADEGKTLYTTKVIRDNGLTPIWNEQATWAVENPDTAFLSFEVFDSDYGTNDLVGSVAIRLLHARQGYRHIPLYNKHGNLVRFASLFIKLEVESLTPSASKIPTKSATI